MLKNFLKKVKSKDDTKIFGALDIFKYIGPGLLVTIGFIDPGNWASNLAAGSEFGYSLLWIVSLSTLMLILLQHNVAHLGIASGLCLAEAIKANFSKWPSNIVLSSAMLASISTSLAELLGSAIALNMLFKIPLFIGAVISFIFVLIMLFTNSYRKIERWIIGFASIIGISFIYELSLVKIDWGTAAISWVVPSVPGGSWVIIMSVLGAVVMPHNLFLHSEIIQSRQWNLEDDKIIKKQLDFEFIDTIFSMMVGWAINSSMIILAAVAFYQKGIKVEELQQAENLLRPLLGGNASMIFAIALLFSGIASSITSGMAGGTISAGFFSEPYNPADIHSKLGIFVSLCAALVIIFIMGNPFKGLIVSQMLLSIQLPITVISQIYLTSSEKVMGGYKNGLSTKILLTATGFTLLYFNIRLFMSFL